MEKIQEIVKTAQEFLINHPQYYGLVFALIGAIGLLAAICNWNWIFEKDNQSFNLQKIDGWVNMFGRNTARVVFGIMSVVLILTGFLVFWLYAFGK